MQINLELYRVFYIAAKCGSLTKAAKELYISQPAVSQSIKQLETQLGGKLFVRTNKGMRLTYEGKIVFEYIKQAYNLIDMAEKKFAEMQELSMGEINISASDTLTKYFLMEHIRNFYVKYPDVSIKITNRTSFESVALLKERSVDMAIISLPFEGEHGLNISECMYAHDCFVCTKSYLKRIAPPLTPEALVEQPLIMLEKLSNSRKVVDKLMEQFGVVAQPQLELGSVDSVTEFTKLGFGIGLSAREFIKDELASGVLVEVPVTFELPPRAFGIATNRDVPMSFATNQFINMLLRH